MAGVITLALPLLAAADAVVFSSAGINAAAIQAQVDAFRNALGNPNNGNNPGPLPGGRREINWDGGGATTASLVGTPFIGFQNTRGALFTTPGTGFLQTPLDAPELLAINASYGTTFTVFSPQRVFTALGSNIIDVTFTVPGSLTPASVNGFGVVFSDVDLADTTTIEFFGVNNSSLGIFSAPAFSNGLSFLGVFFNAGERVGRVRITSGNVALGPNDGRTTDVVVMDDFIYGEPQVAAVPEPATMLLLGTGLIGVVGAARRRRKATPSD